MCQLISILELVAVTHPLHGLNCAARTRSADAPGRRQLHQTPSFVLASELELQTAQSSTWFW